MTVTGAFSLDPSIVLNRIDGSSDGERTGLRFGVDDNLYAEDGLVSIGISSVGDEGFGLNVFSGPWVATYLGEGCTWQINVTETTVSGHVSCSDIPAENQVDGTAGTVDIELDFTATSP